MRGGPKPVPLLEENRLVVGNTRRKSSLWKIRTLLAHESLQCYGGKLTSPFLGSPLLRLPRPSFRNCYYRGLAAGDQVLCLGSLRFIGEAMTWPDG